MITAWTTPQITGGDQPRTFLSWHVGYCNLSVSIWHDEPRVVIHQADYPPREADLLEVEALAERFHSPELAAAAERMRSPTAAKRSVPSAPQSSILIHPLRAFWNRARRWWTNRRGFVSPGEEANKDASRC